MIKMARWWHVHINSYRKISNLPENINIYLQNSKEFIFVVYQLPHMPFNIEMANIILVISNNLKT
jgi:hypothetical protein